MSHSVNLAIQVLPLHKSQEEAYHIIDIAIQCISTSGLHYVVCPFETVIEGPYKEVMALVDTIQEVCNEAGASTVLINMKLQRSFVNDVRIEDKTAKYK